MRRTTRIPSFAAAALIAAAGLSVAVPAEAQARRAAPTAERADWPARAAPAQARAVTFAAAASPSGSLVLPMGSDADLAARGSALDAGTRQAIAAALSAARSDYKARHTLDRHGVGGSARNLVAGPDEPAKAAQLQTAAIVAGRVLNGQPGARTALTSGLSADMASELATGLGLGHYRSDLHVTTGRDRAA